MAETIIDNAGKPARLTGRWPIRREVIGPPECPIIHRWTLVKTRWGKLLLHRFLPNADDRAVHDHPASFVTLVLRGGYDDHVPCSRCEGLGYWWRLDGKRRPCARCEGNGMVLGDRMRPGMVRLRPAEHRHRTRVGPRGCWTLVLMGPKRREWGFWKDARWWPWAEHERAFGFGMRCPDSQEGER